MTEHMGPASFAFVIQTAAKLACEKNNRAEIVRRERSIELKRLAALIDDSLDKRRCREQTKLNWQKHHDLIVALTAQAKSTAEIAKALNDLGFYIDRKDVYIYQVKIGLKDRLNNPYDRSKKCKVE